MHKKRVLWTIAVVSTLVVAGSPQSATAETGIGEQICSTFLSQSGAAVPGDQAALCTCLDQEINNRLSQQDMQAYQDAAASGSPLPAEVDHKVREIAVTCLTRSLAP